jgi:hypothetical protein
VRREETFSATATLISWFRDTPSDAEAKRNSSISEGCRRNEKLNFLMDSNSSSFKVLHATALHGP